VFVGRTSPSQFYINTPASVFSRLTANSACSLCVLLMMSRSCCRVSGRPADSRYSLAAASLGVTTVTLRGSTEPRADMSNTKETLEPRLQRKDGREERKILLEVESSSSFLCFTAVHQLWLRFVAHALLNFRKMSFLHSWKNHVTLTQHRGKPITRMMMDKGGKCSGFMWIQM